MECYGTGVDVGSHLCLTHGNINSLVQHFVRNTICAANFLFCSLTLSTTHALTHLNHEYQERAAESRKDLFRKMSNWYKSIPICKLNLVPWHFLKAVVLGAR